MLDLLFQCYFIGSRGVWPTYPYVYCKLCIFTKTAEHEEPCLRGEQKREV